ncbi:MAG: SDR family NAD(P)-dependent oxidoreductase [Proteobacteria bacterium]|nr:SDR family NAD(P)-dependent oxidoreductase [Pseudomonadota bacterium]
MELKDKIVVITGAASGIGRAMALRFKQEGTRQIICADLNGTGAQETAEMVDGIAFEVNVGRPSEVTEMIDKIEAEVGPIDLFCSNAGISVAGGVEVPDEDWQRIWDINVMSHVWAARALVPLMAARGGGYLLNTSSAAGLLNQVGSAPYGVTKHAAVGLAEWLAMTYGDQGIKVSVLCPQAVRTEMTRGHEDHVAAIDGMMEPEPVADACVETIRAETFLVLPHKQVLSYMRAKTENYDRWIGGMRKLNRKYGGFA